MKSLMKNETAIKLNAIAKRCYEKYGVEVSNFTNYEHVIMNVCSELRLPFSRLTMKRHLHRITYLIKDIHKQRQFEIKLEEKRNYEEKKKDAVKVEESKTIVNYLSSPIRRITFELMDGTIIDNVYSENKVVAIVNNEVEEEIEEEEVFFGLFDYKRNGDIIIRRGTFCGCNVKDKNDIKKYFNKIKWMDHMDQFKGWVVRMLEEWHYGKIMETKDTLRDVDTLKTILKALGNNKK